MPGATKKKASKIELKRKQENQKQKTLQRQIELLEKKIQNGKVVLEKAKIDSIKEHHKGLIEGWEKSLIKVQKKIRSGKSK